MSNRLNELRKTEREFREVSSNLFNTEHTDGLFNLIKFNDFIHGNKEIKKIIKKYDDPSVDLSNYIMKGGHLLYTQFDKPIEDDLHYKYILKYISNLIENSVDLRVEFSFYKQHKKYNDAIQSALKDIVSPLYSFIRRTLVEKIELEDEKEKTQMMNKSQGDTIYNLATDGGTINNAKGNISSSNKSSINKNKGDVIQGDNNTVKKRFYQKEGFWSGVISGIIVGLACWGIEELIKYLIGVLG